MWVRAFWSQRSTSGRLAAVDDHGVPDGERGLLRAQPEHGGGDLLWPAHAADGLLGDDGGAAFFSAAGEAAHHLGVDDAGADRVDADAQGGVVERGRLRQADESVLRRGVRGLAGEALDAGARRRVDDRAAATGEHELDLVLHGHERTAQVDRDEAVPLVVGDLVRRLDRLLDAGVVDRNVQAAEALDRRVQRRSNVVRARDIARRGKRLAARLLDQPGGLLVALRS